jgi:hypothetical protein
MTEERRKEPRQRSLLGGKIITDDRTCSMECTVRNISPGGAMVVMADAFRMPKEFEFAIPLREEMHAATVVWRRANGAGLALSPLEEASATRKTTPRMRRLAMAKQLARGYD